MSVEYTHLRLGGWEMHDVRASSENQRKWPIILDNMLQPCLQLHTYIASGNLRQRGQIWLSISMHTSELQNLQARVAMVEACKIGGGDRGREKGRGGDREMWLREFCSEMHWKFDYGEALNLPSYSSLKAGTLLLVPAWTHKSDNNVCHSLCTCVQCWPVTHGVCVCVSVCEAEVYQCRGAASGLLQRPSQRQMSPIKRHPLR